MSDIISQIEAAEKAATPGPWARVWLDPEQVTDNVDNTILIALMRNNIRALIDVVKAAEYCLGVGPGILHVEECPGDPDYADEDFFGPCECGAEKWSNAISKLRTK